MHPLASASCSVGIVTIVIAAIPNKAAAAATMAITINAVLFILSGGKEDRV